MTFGAIEFFTELFAEIATVVAVLAKTPGRVSSCKATASAVKAYAPPSAPRIGCRVTVNCAPSRKVAIPAVVNTVSAHIGMKGPTAGSVRLARGAAIARVSRMSSAIIPANTVCLRVACWIRKPSIQSPNSNSPPTPGLEPGAGRALALRTGLLGRTRDRRDRPNQIDTGDQTLTGRACQAHPALPDAWVVRAMRIGAAALRAASATAPGVIAQ